MVTTIEDIIKDKQITMIADSVKLDANKRVVLSKVKVQKGIRYHIYRNRFGQIILDPQVAIPASEAWLFNNPDTIASVRRGLADAAEGRVSKIDMDTL